MSQTTEKKRRCIYCMQWKRSGKKESEFTKEHVINAAFVPGFGGQGQTLVGLVCDSCNQSFKDTLDVELTKKAPEALMRFISGNKSADRFHEFATKNAVTSSSVLLPDSNQNGAPVKVQFIDGKLVGDLAKPISLQRPDGSDPEHIGEQEFFLGAWKKLQEPKVNLTITAVPELLTLINDWMALKEIKFNILSEQSAEEAQRVPFGLKVSMTPLYRRAIAKTAFNYLAFVTKERLPNLIFDEQFDPIRTLILSGEEPKLEPVEKVQDPEPGLLEKATGLQHKLSIKVGKYKDSYCLVCDVQIFCFAVWRVFLVDDYMHIDPFIQVSHVWDWDTRTVAEIPNPLAGLAKAGNALKEGEAPVILTPTQREIQATNQSRIWTA